MKQYHHGVHATEYCRLFALKMAYKGGGGGEGHGHPRNPSSYAPGILLSNSVFYLYYYTGDTVKHDRDFSNDDDDGYDNVD